MERPSIAYYSVYNSPITGVSPESYHALVIKIAT